jgi:hypothetical protein
VAVMDNYRTLKNSGSWTAERILSAQNSLHQETGKDWRDTVAEVKVHDKSHLPPTSNSNPNCSQ